MNVLEYFDVEKLAKSDRLTIVGVEFVNANNYKELVRILGAAFLENINLKVDIFSTSDTFEFFEKLESIPIEYENNEPFRNNICGLNSSFVDDIIEYIAVEEEFLRRHGARHGLSFNLPENWRDVLCDNVFIRMDNLRHSFNAILYADVFLYAPSIDGIISADDYLVLAEDDSHYDYYHTRVTKHLDYLLSGKGGKKFLSKPDTEMIGIYETVSNVGNKLDGMTVCRGAAPRSAFYFENSINSLVYKRHSVWEFIFNRKGELLLHQRSTEAKDNNMLWDKSAGGHVDRSETSTAETAKRELIEELFFADDMGEKYLSGQLATITDFGEWIPTIRPNASFLGAFDYCPDENFIMFHATNRPNQKMPPMPWTTEGLVSKRRLCTPVKTGKTKNIVRGKHKIKIPEIRVENQHDMFTYFISDVYFVIAPENMIDTTDQMYDRLYKVYENGAAYDHRLITIDDLQAWIIREGANAENVFTSDLLYLFSRLDFVRILKDFSLFIKNQFAPKK